MTMLTYSVRHLAAALVVGALVIATLVMGQTILVPLAGAAIVSFMLAPIVRWLSARGVPHSVSVGSVFTLVLTVLAAVTLLLSVELLGITARLSDYRENLIAKVRTVANVGRDDGALKRAAEAIERLSEAVGREWQSQQAAPRPSTQGDVPIAVRNVDSQSAVDMLSDFIEPATQLALFVLFTLFLLLQHQDMRDRIVRIFGTDHLSETTSAMSEAGKRLSRLFLAQGVLSTAYGVMIGIVLAIAGLPGALVWAVLAGLMRFVPFIGSFIAAIPPILLAASVDPGWGLAIFTTVFFLVSDAVMGNLIEPTVLGRRVGLSPFAMLAAASFWTLVWGPVGLLLAAPLTMALVVLGRYVDGLSFVTILLGDEPALEPEQELYHRLLSGDSLSAADQIEAATTTATIAQAADNLVLPALALASHDARNGRLSDAQTKTIREALEEAAEFAPQLAESEDVRHHDTRVLVVPARGEIDITTARFVASIIRTRTGHDAIASTHATGLTALADGRPREGEQNPAAIVIATVGGMPRRQLRFIAGRAARDFPLTRILVLAPPSGLPEARSAGPINERDHAGKQLSTVAELLANMTTDLPERPGPAPQEPMAHSTPATAE